MDALYSSSSLLIGRSDASAFDMPTPDIPPLAYHSTRHLDGYDFPFDPLFPSTDQKTEETYKGRLCGFHDDLGIFGT